MAKIIGQKIGGGSSILTTPIQVTGLKATGKDGGIALSIDSPTEASYPYLKDYWVVWKKVSDGPIQHPYDGAHMTFDKPVLVTGQNLSNLTPGSTLKIMENNKTVPFLVLQAEYPNAGDNNVLLWRKDIHSLLAWGSTNAYASSAINTFLNEDYLLLLEEKVRSKIPTVSIPYTIGGGNTTSSTLDAKCFLLSNSEVGFSTSQYVKADGLAISYFSDNSKRISNYNGSPYNQHLRTPYTLNTQTVVVIMGDGSPNNFGSNSPFGICPAFCLPCDTLVSPEPDSDGDYTLV